MEFDVRRLYNQSVFVDANAIIYHLQGLCPTAKRIFRLGEHGGVRLVSSSRVIDEVIFKILLIQARDKFDIGTKVASKLRKDKDKVKELAEDIRIVYEFLDVVKMRIEDGAWSDLKKMLEIMKEYGLFGNDALILGMMKKLGLKFLLSSDQDFKDIEGVTLILIKPE